MSSVKSFSWYRNFIFSYIFDRTKNVDRMMFKKKTGLADEMERVNIDKICHSAIAQLRD